MGSNSKKASIAIGGKSDDIDVRYARMHTDPRFRDPPPTLTLAFSIASLAIVSCLLLHVSTSEVSSGPSPSPLTTQYSAITTTNTISAMMTMLPLQNKYRRSKTPLTDDSESDADTTDTDESCEDEEEEEATINFDKLTHRLAVVKQDWTRVKAVDLFKALSSFVPPNGFIKSVAVYPTEFGLQRMKTTMRS